MGSPIPFQVPTGVKIVGQPFTVTGVAVPMNMTLTCNCGGAETTVTILGSVSAPCPSCGKVYNAIFNPTNNQIQMQIGVPAEKVPS